MGEVRIVPSGKVYRQIFDAEVQLVCTLGEVRRKSLHREVGSEYAKIPVVRAVDKSEGFLTRRQRSWAEGMQNDNETENPVVYKRLKEDEQSVESASWLSQTEDVVALPNDVVSGKIGGNLIQMISENKQEQHLAAEAKLYEELAIISEELEQLYLEAGDNLHQQVEESRQRTQELFSEIENGDLGTTELQELNTIGDNISNLSQKRNVGIKKLFESYQKFEEERVKRSTDALKECTITMEKISYLMKPDVHRYIDKEAMMINQALLANQRALYKLYVNLIESGLSMEMSDRLQWKYKEDEMKVIERDRIIQKFTDYVGKDWGLEFTPNQTLFNEEQKSLNDTRIEILESLGNMIPPTFSKVTVIQKHTLIKILNEKIELLNSAFIQQFQTYFEKVYRQWMEEIEKWKQKMLQANICSPEENEELIISEFFPKIGASQRKFEEEQWTMDQKMEEATKRVNTRCNKFFQYCQKVVNLWEVHLTLLTGQEDELKQNLDKCRALHDEEIQRKEAHLDLAVDKLRQKNTENELISSLATTECLLDNIKKEYNEFYHKQMELVENYISITENELDKYKVSLCNCFHIIETSNLKEKMEEESVPSEFEAVVHTEDLTLETVDQKQKVPQPDRSDILQADSNQSQNINRQPPEREIVTERTGFEEQSLNSQEINQSPNLMILEHFTTSRGHTYAIYVVPKIPEQISKKVFLIEPDEDVEEKQQQEGEDDDDDEEEEEEEEPLACVKNILISKEMFSKIKKRICFNLFEHFEDWYEIALENARTIIMGQNEEFKGELELRLHLHEPRVKRIKMDVLNVRAAELRLHKEKVKRHCKGVEESLTKLQADFLILKSEHCKFIVNFRRNIYSMETIFRNATKSDRLITMVNSLHSKLDKHMTAVRMSLRNFQQKLEKTLQELRDRNALCMTSFRLFSKGGNFTPEEIEIYGQSLENTARNIAKTEGLILVDLEVMETLSLEQASEVIRKFEDKFFRLTMDLIFIEKIQRFLTNTQARIKSEVAISNHQGMNISSYLEHFERKLDACMRPNMDKESVTPEELYDFSKIILDLLDKRSRYLNCLLGPTVSGFPLQGPISLAARADKQESRLTFTQSESLLHPSRMGKHALDDVVISVIHDITQTQKIKVANDQFFNPVEDQLMYGASSQPVNLSSSFRMTSGTGPHGLNLKLSRPAPSPFSITSTNLHKYSKPNRFDPKYQIFGEKPEDSEHFKGLIRRILWEGTTSLLALAEEYYKKKDRTPVTRPEYLKDTFEQCADELLHKMQSYLIQAENYQNTCLQEFREKLREFVEMLSHVPQLLIKDVFKFHMESISVGTAETRSALSKKLEELEHAKLINKNKLRPVLGHPDHVKDLEKLCTQEEERQKAEVQEINSYTEKLQKRVTVLAQHFVSALSSLAERLLVESDNILTIDDIQVGRREEVKQKTSALIRIKIAGHTPEDDIHQPQVQLPRDGRIWKGIPFSELSHKQIQTSIKETASVKTTKTTMVHQAAVDARNDAYLNYKDHFIQLLAQIEQDREAKLTSARRWQDFWKECVQKAKQLYT
ncbi:coiled-coil domain-containing protein 180 [Callorhinchus milii]|uniref:coiled-coil domain-containing protein 180 n=1 Tax=Callorhinchus milii TaxID=7868 RepID=UPI001C3F5637|nr:coiled-coil domain-containing protein 180 [Callorhinchus milii]